MKRMRIGAWIKPGLVAILILGLVSARDCVGAPSPQGQGIIISKHNLSASGANAIRAIGQDEICVFCHTPHGVKAKTPLWNHFDSTAVYTPYTSSTKKAIVGQPTGDSKLCLSCHDGTVAVGLTHKGGRQAVVSRLQALTGTKSRLGTDLSDDHPVSFTYDHALAVEDGKLADPSTLGRDVRLDANGQMQCTSCHTAHDNRFGHFLVRDNYGSALCVTCHKLAQWPTSDHRNSAKSWNGTGVNPWPHTDQKTVAANGCENCHRPHSAGGKQRLLNSANPEENCYPCHNGNVAGRDIQSEFKKASVHPVESSAGVHDPAENSVNSPRHSQCADCHDPHSSNAQSAAAPAAPGALAGVRGVTATGALTQSIKNEYELCFRCHGDSVAKGPARVERQFVQTNTRLEFNSANASFHPVETTGRNASVPSLIAPWTTASVTYCTDCHNNNNGPGAGGSGPKGPHGSMYAPLLERRLELTDNQPESPAAYALCYKCHSRASILGDQSFKSHNKHVSEVRSACTTCHDSHGSPTQTKLINFNVTYVSKSSSGRLEYIDKGGGRGSCFLTCHGKNHNPLSY